MHSFKIDVDGKDFGIKKLWREFHALQHADNGDNC